VIHAQRVLGLVELGAGAGGVRMPGGREQAARQS
jgi:hypothetical protein